MKIVIHSGVNERSRPYLDRMKETALYLADDPDHLSFREHIIPDESHGSGGHSDWLSSALAQFTGDSGVINIIADADTLLLMRGWDTLIRGELLCGGVDIFGVSYEAIGGPSSGPGAVQTYKGQPNATWLATAPHVDLCHLDPSPQKESHLAIAGSTRSSIYGLPEGYELLRDVLWTLPGHIREMSYTTRVAVHERDNPVSIDPGNTYSEEFHYGGHPFLFHQRGASRIRYGVDRLNIESYASAGEYIRSLG